MRCNLKHSINPQTLFQQLPFEAFTTLADRWQVDKNTRRLSTKAFLGILLTAKIFQHQSLRETGDSFGFAKSTLSDAFSRRPAGFFVDLCDAVMRKMLSLSPSRHERQGIRHLLALDSTEILIDGRLKHFRPFWLGKSSKAAAKLHVIFDIDGKWIRDFLMTSARDADLPVAKLFPLEKGVTYVFDRAYMDLTFWIKIQKSRADFVTRLKSSARNEIIKEKATALADSNDGVLLDARWTPSESACLRNHIPKFSVFFRQVVYRDAETKKIFHFITSDWESSGEEIALIYKKRWAIELLFKWMKGHFPLHILKTRTINAVRIELAVVILVQLLIALLRLRNGPDKTLTGVLREIRVAAFRGIRLDLGAPLDAFENGPPSQYLMGRVMS